MQDKRNVKCSFCDRIVSTTFSAVICSECEAMLLTKYCPGCGQPVNAEVATKEHMRLWHPSCYSLFKLDENDEDIKDYDSAVKPTTKISRKILTGNSTYLFYDKERKLKGPGRFAQRLDSISSIRRNTMETTNSRNVDGLSDGEDDDFGYLSPLNDDIDEEGMKSSYLSTTVRQIVYRLQTLGFVKERTVDRRIYPDSISGHDFISFLLNKRICDTTEKAKEIGQEFIKLGIFVPYDMSEGNEEDEDEEPEEQSTQIVFEGGSELYSVDTSVLEEEASDYDYSETTSPDKEHNNMVRMTGCLTINKDGKSQQLWCELTAGILRLYEMVNGKKKEDGESRCMDALDTQEFTVVPIMKNNQMTDTFKLVGTVREIVFQAESIQMCEEWISVLRTKD